MSDKDQRTEQPTQQKLKKAADEGRLPASREFVASAQFAAFVALVCVLGARWFSATELAFRSMLQGSFTLQVQASSAYARFAETALSIGQQLALLGGSLVAAAVFAQSTVTGFRFAGAKLAPDFSRLNPLSTLRELPGRNKRALFEALLMLPLMLGLFWAVVSAHWQMFLELPMRNIRTGIASVAETLSSILKWAALLLVTWGVVDVFRQKRRYTRDLRMTKQELREEAKQSDGNPEIKMKIRRMRRELLRRRMMAEVPAATAVIVNPTHFAVALRYELQDASAPKVVAKGKNFLALRIREKALSHQVPVIENPPLAQALYKNVEVGQEIPAHLYRAVAEVLAYVFRMMKGLRPER